MQAPFTKHQKHKEHAQSTRCIFLSRLPSRHQYVILAILSFLILNAYTVTLHQYSIPQLYAQTLNNSFFQATLFKSYAGLYCIHSLLKVAFISMNMPQFLILKKHPQSKATSSTPLYSIARINMLQNFHIHSAVSTTQLACLFTSFVIQRL